MKRAFSIAEIRLRRTCSSRLLWNCPEKGIARRWCKLDGRGGVWCLRATLCVKIYAFAGWNLQSQAPGTVARRENSLVDFHTGAVEGDVALIACDCLCDVSSSQEATDVVRKGLVENADDPVRAGREPLFNSSRRPRVARRLTAVVPALRPAEPEGIS